MFQKTYTVEKEYYTVSKGDLNAKIGPESSNRKCVCEYLIGKTNKNGLCLLRKIT